MTYFVPVGRVALALQGVGLKHLILAHYAQFSLPATAYFNRIRQTAGY